MSEIFYSKQHAWVKLEDDGVATVGISDFAQEQLGELVFVELPQLGLLVTAGLLRFGPSFENIAWASLFFLAPLGCIYYPIEILPNTLQIIAKALPLVHIFEEMRNILINNTVNSLEIFRSIAISFFYFVLGVVIFYIAYYGAKKRGTLINIGE